VFGGQGARGVPLADGPICGSTSDGTGTHVVLVLDRDDAAVEFHLDDGQVLAGNLERNLARDGTKIHAGVDRQHRRTDPGQPWRPSTGRVSLELPGSRTNSAPQRG
jgi:hypothetical protein